MIRSTVALILVLGAGTPLGADTYPRQPGIDAQHYAVAIRLLTGESNEIEAQATVTLRIVAADVRGAVLDLTSATADGRGMTVTSVTSNGRAVPFEHRDNRLHLTVPPGTAPGDDLVFTISYHGVPANGLRLLTTIHGERAAFSENWYNRARQWLPTIDHPADKATGELAVTTRAEYQVVSNGVLVEEADLPGGLRRTVWRQDVPISSWLFSLGVAHFVVRHGDSVRGIPISFWAFPQDAEKGLAALARDARESFEFFSEWIGPYAYGKLAHVEAAGMGGGTEHATNIFYGEKGVSAGSAPVVHETAHQWFGDAVTESDWNDVWLSEGFATYFTLLYTEHAAGRDAFVDGLRRSREAVLRLERSLPGTPVVHRNLNEATTAPNNRLVYEKGAWTLHMLRELVGDDAFWRGIRLYYRRHMNGVASTADFRRAMQEASGLDLSSFFAEWLTRTGEPVLAGTWRYDAAPKQVVVTVRQMQDGEPFQFPLDIGLWTASRSTADVRHVQVTDRASTFTIPVDADPRTVTLDPGVRLLAEVGALQASPAGSRP